MMHHMLPHRSVFSCSCRFQVSTHALRSTAHATAARSSHVGFGLMANQPTESVFGDSGEFKQHYARLWSKRADSYHNQTHEGAGILKPLAGHMAGLVVERLRGLDASQALDIACGSGEPALTIAKAVPTCSVVATDLAPGMVEAAQRRGADEGVENFRAEVADAEDLSAFADGTFDAVTCCAGLMLVPDHNRALREWHRVSKPGGRMAAAVWAQAGERTQMIMVMRGLAMKLATGVQMKGNPNQLSDAEQLGKDVDAAGFRDVELSEFNVPMEVPGEHLEEAMLQNPMIADFLDQAKAKGRDAIYEEALAAAKEVAAEQGRQRSDGGISCPVNVAIVVTATA